MVKFKAIGVSEGLAKAKALVIKEEDLSVVKETVADAEAECKRVLDAVEKAKQQIEVLRDDAEKNIGAAEAEIFDAHLMMLDDPDFVEGMTNIVTDEKVCAEYACFVNCENFQAMFRALDDEYMQARAADIGDISQRARRDRFKNFMERGKLFKARTRKAAQCRPCTALPVRPARGTWSAHRKSRTGCTGCRRRSPDCEAARRQCGARIRA